MLRAKAGLTQFSASTARVQPKQSDPAKKTPSIQSSIPLMFRQKTSTVSSANKKADIAPVTNPVVEEYKRKIDEDAANRAKQEKETKSSGRTRPSHARPSKKRANKKVAVYGRYVADEAEADDDEDASGGEDEDDDDEGGDDDDSWIDKDDEVVEDDDEETAAVDSTGTEPVDVESEDEKLSSRDDPMHRGDGTLFAHESKMQRTDVADRKLADMIGLHWKLMNNHENGRDFLMLRAFTLAVKRHQQALLSDSPLDLDPWFAGVTKQPRAIGCKDISARSLHVMRASNASNKSFVERVHDLCFKKGETVFHGFTEVKRSGVYMTASEWLYEYPFGKESDDSTPIYPHIWTLHGDTVKVRATYNVPLTLMEPTLVHVHGTLMPNGQATIFVEQQTPDMKGDVTVWTGDASSFAKLLILMSIESTRTTLTDRILKRYTIMSNKIRKADELVTDITERPPGKPSHAWNVADVAEAMKNVDKKQELIEEVISKSADSCTVKERNHAIDTFVESFPSRKRPNARVATTRPQSFNEFCNTQREGLAKRLRLVVDLKKQLSSCIAAMDRESQDDKAGGLGKVYERGFELKWLWSGVHPSLIPILLYFVSIECDRHLDTKWSYMGVRYRADMATAFPRVLDGMKGKYDGDRPSSPVLESAGKKDHTEKKDHAGKIPVSPAKLNGVHGSTNSNKRKEPDAKVEQAAPKKRIKINEKEHAVVSGASSDASAKKLEEVDGLKESQTGSDPSATVARLFDKETERIAKLASDPIELDEEPEATPSQKSAPTAPAPTTPTTPVPTNGYDDI